MCRKRSSAFANKVDNAEKPKTADSQLLRITKKRTSERSGKVHNGDNTAAKVKKEIEVTVAKKQGAASFLKRIKQNSPVKEKLEDGGGEEKKKKGERWRDGEGGGVGRERVLRGRVVKEGNGNGGSQGKKGRPRRSPVKQGKTVRESVESRKRSRR